MAFGTDGSIIRRQSHGYQHGYQPVRETDAHGIVSAVLDVRSGQHWRTGNI